MADAIFPSVFRANVLVTGTDGLSVFAGGIGVGLTATEMGAIGVGDVVADNKMAVNATVADVANDLHVIGAAGITSTVSVGAVSYGGLAAGEIAAATAIYVGLPTQDISANTSVGDNILFVEGDMAAIGNLFLGDNLTVNNNLTVLNSVTLGTGDTSDNLFVSIGQAFVNAQLTKIELDGTASAEVVYINADTLTSIHMAGAAGTELIEINADTAKLTVSGATSAEQIYANAALAKIQLDGTVAAEVVYINADTLTTVHMSGVAASETIHVNANTAKIALDGSSGTEQIYANAALAKIQLNGTAAAEVVYISADTLTTVHMSGVAASETIHVNANTAKIALDGSSGTEQIYINAGATGKIDLDGTTGSEVTYINTGSTKIWVDGGANNVLFTAADVNFSADVTISGDLFLTGGLQLPGMTSEVVDITDAGTPVSLAATGIPIVGSMMVMVASENGSIAPTAVFVCTKSSAGGAGTVLTLSSTVSVINVGTSVINLDMVWPTGAAVPTLGYTDAGDGASNHSYGVTTLIASGVTPT